MAKKTVTGEILAVKKDGTGIRVLVDGESSAKWLNFSKYMDNREDVVKTIREAKKSDKNRKPVKATISINTAKNNREYVQDVDVITTSSKLIEKTKDSAEVEKSEENLEEDMVNHSCSNVSSSDNVSEKAVLEMSIDDFFKGFTKEAHSIKNLCYYNKMAVQHAVTLIHALACAITPDGTTSLGRLMSGNKDGQDIEMLMNITEDISKRMVVLYTQSLLEHIENLLKNPEMAEEEIMQMERMSYDLT